MAAANVIAPKPLLSLPLVRDDELAHHSCALMLQNMAMIHVWEIRIGIIVETHQNTHAFPTSAEHTSELPSLMRNSHADSCLKQKNKPTRTTHITYTTITCSHHL